MGYKLSKRLNDLLLSLPLKEGNRVFEVGCGTGALARAVLKCVGVSGYVLAIDRSEKAIQGAILASKAEISTGRLVFRKIAIEKFELNADEQLFDIAIAIRVGALDGRHPEIEQQSLINIARSLTKEGRLFIDGGNPLKEINLDEYR